MAELYIGFLVAAATNRAERELRKLIEQISYTISKVEKINTDQNKILDLLLKYEKKDLVKDDQIIKEVKKSSKTSRGGRT